MNSNSSSTTLTTLAITIGALACGSSDNDSTGTTSGTGSQGENCPSPGTMGDLETELQYFLTNGDGRVTTFDDPSNSDRSATPIEGSSCSYRIRYNSTQLTQAGPWVLEFFLRHEFGHAFHQHETIGVDRRMQEHEADAYATRMLYHQFGSASAQAMVNWFSGTGAPPDATHPSHATRALYMSDVLSRVQSTPSSIPTPPPTTASVTVNNPFGQTVNVYIDGAYAGWLFPGNWNFAVLPADYLVGDSHYIEARSAHTGFSIHGSWGLLYGGQQYSWP